MEEHIMLHKANSIARFWVAYPHEEAVAGVASHLKSFWVPGMQRQLLAYIEAGGSGLDELVLEAAQQLEPASQR